MPEHPQCAAGRASSVPRKNLIRLRFALLALPVLGQNLIYVGAGPSAHSQTSPPFVGNLTIGALGFHNQRRHRMPAGRLGWLAGAGSPGNLRKRGGVPPRISATARGR